jgi:dTDP-4-amino-4,6-dideoxygalactose transaminase
MNAVMKIPFSPPYVDDDVRKEVLETLDSGWITTGPKVKALEEELCRKFSLEAALCCNSATSGLMLALHWFGIGKGDEVIIPAYTYAATALAVLHVGATPVMVDVDRDLVIDPEKFKAKITERTKAVIPVDIAGWPCDYAAIISIVTDEQVKRKFKPSVENQAKLGRILMLADSAHSIGAIYNGKQIGHWADITVFSLHAVKNVTTAEGGVLCLNLPAPFDNKDLYKLLRLWTLNGQTKDALTKTQGGGWRYDIIYPGFKINMPDVCAAIGLAQLRKYHELMLPERHSIFEQYLKAFSECDWAELPVMKREQSISSCHLFPLRIKNISEDTRDKIIESITAKGVSVNVHFMPLPLLTLFKNLGYNIKDYPVAYDQYSREISLPVYHGITAEQVNYIVQTVMESYLEITKIKTLNL